MLISFTIPIRPVPMGTKIIWLPNKKIRNVKSPRSQKWQADAQPFINQAFKGKPALADYVEIEVLFFFAPPKSWANVEKLKAISGKLRPTTKTSTGDVDNLCKALFDALTVSGYLLDDSLVVSLFAAKYYSNEERTEVRIRRIKHSEEER